MASKYSEFAYYDENSELHTVKYKTPLRIRVVTWVYSKLFRYVYNATIRDRRRRYARYMRKRK